MLSFNTVFLCSELVLNTFYVFKIMLSTSGVLEIRPQFHKSFLSKHKKVYLFNFVGMFANDFFKENT